MKNTRYPTSFVGVGVIVVACLSVYCWWWWCCCFVVGWLNVLNAELSP